MAKTDLGTACPARSRSAGQAACFAADEFFSARISNPHTRHAYARPVGRFLAWCEEQGIELRQVTPGLAGCFIQELPGSDPTRNLALAALRHFFDALVTRHAVALNPFASVRGQKHAVVDGKTPELTIGQARVLLGSLDLSRAVGLRRMLKRRLKAAGLPEIITPHSFRVIVVTDLLSQDVPMEDVQYLAGHSNPRTTQIYDRRRRRVTRNIVEYISV